MEYYTKIMWIKKFIGILAINQKSPKDITEGILLFCSLQRPVSEFSEFFYSP